MEKVYFEIHQTIKKKKQLEVGKKSKKKLSLMTISNHFIFAVNEIKVTSNTNTTLD